MRLKLYQQITLREDFPAYRLKKGQPAMLVDYITHPHGGETGGVLELFDESGESSAVVVVPQSLLEPSEKVNVANKGMLFLYPKVVVG